MRGAGGGRGFGPFFSGDSDFERLWFGGVNFANYLQGDSLADFFGANLVPELLGGVGAFAVNGGDDVAGF